VGILVLVLIVSVGLNLYDHFIVIPQMQATINNMRVQALDAWLGMMQKVNNILKHAKTNIDVKDAHNHTSWAEPLVHSRLTYGIDIWEHQNEFYYWISKVAFYLDEALVTVHFGNKTGPVTERNLDQNVLTMIENITTTYDNSETKIRSHLSSNGVEPVQQLREAGVLADVLIHLEQIYQISADILNYFNTFGV